MGMQQVGFVNLRYLPHLSHHSFHLKVFPRQNKFAKEIFTVKQTRPNYVLTCTWGPLRPREVLVHLAY